MIPNHANEYDMTYNHQRTCKWIQLATEMSISFRYHFFHKFDLPPLNGKIGLFHPAYVGYF